MLGLSLNSDEVAWVLLNATDGSVLDHDALELHADAELAGAAVRSAHAIARACGFEVDRVRLAWTGDALRLRSRLGRLGLGDVEAVPMACALKVLVDPEATGITPRLALAYGAALAVVRPGEVVLLGEVVRPGEGVLLGEAADPEVPPISERSRLPRRRIVPGVAGLAAAAVLGFLCLSAGAAPQMQSPVATTEGFAPASVGWVTVPAPQVAATMVRKVVDVPAQAEQSSTIPVQDYFPLRTVHGAGPARNAAPTEVAHLAGARQAMGPLPGPAEVSATSPAPDMTDMDDVFTVLP